jgi:hypothetical protein
MAASAAVGVYRVLPIDTTPGANHVFAPPEGFKGSKQDYLQLIRWRWATKLDASQQIESARGYVRRNPGASQYVGPFADEARYIITALNEQS